MNVLPEILNDSNPNRDPGTRFSYAQGRDSCRYYDSVLSTQGCMNEANMAVLGRSGAGSAPSRMSVRIVSIVG